jgi:hypothetical protein
MFIPEPELDFFTHPGSGSRGQKGVGSRIRIQGPKRRRIPDPDPGAKKASDPGYETLLEAKTLGIHKNAGRSNLNYLYSNNITPAQFQ